MSGKEDELLPARLNFRERKRYAESNPALKSLYDHVVGVSARIDKTLSQLGLTDSDMLAALLSQEALGTVLRPKGAVAHVLAPQYEHFAQVAYMALELKKYLVDLKLPERTVAYQLGTGFKLPVDGEQMKRVGFIPYGKGPLSYFINPNVEGHSQNAGMYVYHVHRHDDQEYTLLAIKGREHGYARTDMPFPAHRLALMPRLLKMIGTEYIVPTFASGPNVVPVNNFDGYQPINNSFYDSKVQIGDLMAVTWSADHSGASSFLDPGSGDQTLLQAIFGGPFKNLARNMSDQTLVSKFLDSQRALRDRENVPEVYPAFLVDAQSAPHFENGMHWALLQVVTDYMLKYKVLPPHALFSLFEHGFVATHGMSATPELNNYFMGTDGEEATLSNRRLPYLGLAMVTDHVDPREQGMSNEISHQVVLKQAEQGAEKIANTLTHFFLTAA